MYMRYIDLHFPSLSGFFASFWCRSNVGQCRSKTNLSQKSKNFLRVPFSALPSFRGDSRWRSFPYLLYRENFYFFPRVRKVYIWVSPTVTSQFFGLFCPFFVTVGDGRPDNHHLSPLRREWIENRLNHPLAPRNPRTRSLGHETSDVALQAWENALPALEQAFCGFAGESTHLRPPWNAAALERS